MPIKRQLAAIPRAIRFWPFLLVFPVFLYMLVEDGVVRTLPYLVLPACWLIWCKAGSRRRRALVLLCSAMAFGVLMLAASPALRTETGVFSPLRQVSAATESSKELAAAADAEPLNPSLQIVAAQADPSDFGALARALREAPGSPAAWADALAATVPDRSAAWQGLYLADPNLSAALAARYAAVAGGPNHQVRKGVTGYYSVAAYLWAYTYSLDQSDQNAAKAAECYFLSGNTRDGNTWLSRIGNADLRDRVAAWEKTVPVSSGEEKVLSEPIR